MTDEEIGEFFAQQVDAGRDVQRAWFDEFIRHPEGKQHLRELIEEANGDLASALATLLYDFADAQGRRARKPRPKVIDVRKELAEWCHEQVDNPLWVSHEQALWDGLEVEDDENRPVVLCNGAVDVWRDRDGHILWAEPDGRRPKRPPTIKSFVRHHVLKRRAISR